MDNTGSTDDSYHRVFNASISDVASPDYGNKRSAAAELAINPLEADYSVTTQTREEKGFEHEESSHRHKFFESGGFLSTFFNFTKNTLGGGVLALPLAMYNAGGLIGCIVLVVCCLLSIMTVRYIGLCIEWTGLHNYEELSQSLVAGWFRVLTILLVTVICLGACVSYVVALSNIFDTMKDLSSFPTILKNNWGISFLTTFFWLIFMFPLSMLHNINSLRFSSMIGVFAICYLFITVLIMTFTSSNTNFSRNIAIGKFDMGMVLAMPLCTFSYGVQPIAFPAYTALKKRTVKNLTMIISASCIFCTIIYIIFGLAGAAMFGKDINGNILSKMSPEKYTYELVSQIIFSICLMFSYPVVMLPARLAVIQALGYRDPECAPFYIYFTVAGVLSLLAVLAGIFIPDITIIFGLVGGLCGGTLFFVWPCIFVLRSGRWTVMERGILEVSVTWLIIVVGVISGVLGTFSSIYAQATKR